jgi:hypothetical protein
MATHGPWRPLYPDNLCDKEIVLGFLDEDHLLKNLLSRVP